MATINDIPEEVLLHIIEYVHPGPAETSDGLSSLRIYDKAQDRNIADIKSLRLTCRKLSRLATGPLFKSASFSILDAQSLKRLEHISRHPHLSQHVKIIHVKLGFYDPVLAQDIVVLAKYTLWAWEDLQQPAPDDTVGWATDETTEEVAMRCTLEEWVYISKYGNRGDRERLFPVLHQIQDEYRHRYMVQQALRKNGNAIRRVGQAMARMPAATSMILQDTRQAHSHLGPLLLSTLSAKADPARLALPLSWTDCARLKEEPGLREFTPPFDLMIDVPVTAHRAGVVLTELRVLGLQIPDELPAWDAIDPYGWERHPTEAAFLDRTDEIQIRWRRQSSWQRPARIFGFSNSIPRLGSSKTWSRLGYTTLTTHCHVSARFWNKCANTDIHYHEEILKTAFWPHLQSLRLQNGRLETADTLLNLIRNLPKLSNLQLDSLTLNYFHMGGSTESRWSYLLDELKKERTMDGVKSEIDIGFNQERGGFTEVDNYLRGVTDVNPVVAIFEGMGLIAAVQSLGMD
ncbi:hypothetical protein PspLS_02979 [Pyricularia sp. CBS 133598]|nr:hypothetical protein PspLS_02979 [Pyricularia sp. CBS 133598]